MGTGGTGGSCTGETVTWGTVTGTGALTAATAWSAVSTTFCTVWVAVDAGALAGDVGELAAELGAETPGRDADVPTTAGRRVIPVPTARVWWATVCALREDAWAWLLTGRTVA